MKYILTTLIALAIMLSPIAETKSQQVTDYQTAVGLRVAWGISATGKHFINDNHAIEGILNYRSFGSFGFRWSWTRISGLYLVHNSLEDVLPNLTWYWGGGAYVGFYGGDYSFPGTRRNSTFFGISGALGLDYSFDGTPINISLDWIPSIGISGTTGFTGESGGIAVRYILK